MQAKKEELPEGFSKIFEGHYRNSSQDDFYTIKSFKEVYEHIDMLRTSNNEAQNKKESNESLLLDATPNDDKIEVLFDESKRKIKGWAYRETLLQDYYEARGASFI